MIRPIVSLIITTKNEEKNIGNCLESIGRQTYPQNLLEVIVVDNDSTDQTKQVAREYKVKVLDKGPERSAQRNYGIEKSEGKYIIYLDADMILSPTVVEKSVEKLEKNDLVALYIPEVILGNSYWSRVRRLERSFYDSSAIDCVRFVRKDVFEQVRGFDLSMTGPEDWDFDKKVREKGKVGLLDTYDFGEIDHELMKIDYQRNVLVEKLSRLNSCALIYHNEAKFNLKKYFKKKKYYTKSFAIYIRKWGKDDLDIKKQFGPGYRYLGVFIENGKWKKLLAHPILVAGMFALRFIVGLTYLFS